jgi:hypothetical protein
VTLQEILNTLREGKTLQLTFSNSGDREKFRVSIYRAKKAEDKHLTDILDEDRLTLRWKPSKKPYVIPGVDAPLTLYLAKFWLENKPSDNNYEVEILDE